MDWLDKTELEWTYKRDLDQLRLKAGEVFEGDATLALAKALLESGVNYIGGYQGAPIAYLMDCLTEAKDLLDELGISYHPSANEAAAAAKLGASINYPLRGVAIWKSVAGMGVATDALANLATAGVKGGTLIISGADFGEGSNVGQERTLGSALKSHIWLMDPRPNLATIVHLAKKSFELSEASNTPVILELRIRSSHVSGKFVAADNVVHGRSGQATGVSPDRDYGRLVLPPATFAQEAHRTAQRLPAAQAFIEAENLNEIFSGTCKDIGIITQGGQYNSVQTALRDLGLADSFQQTEVPILVLNVLHPLVPSQLIDFCADKRAVLVIEEGQPAYLEQSLNDELRKAGLDTRVVGKDVLTLGGEYTPDIILQGLWKFLEGSVPADLDLDALASRYRSLVPNPDNSEQPLGDHNLARPPGFCTGCPERPVFSALSLLQREIGEVHLSADIGCHLYSTLPPFDMGHTILGYGLGLASAAGVSPHIEKRVLSTMGDGGFWHSGLTSGIAGAVNNDEDAVLVIFDNGYTASTGAQTLPSTPRRKGRRSIESALRGVGVTWVRKVRSYAVAKVKDTLEQAMSTGEGGLKVIIAEGECQLAIQRREAPDRGAAINAGNRMRRTRYGIDDATCTGDHACIRLSGCPSLTVKDNPDPLRSDPVSHVSEECVGCGLCGEVAHAAILCPSFYRAEVIHNAGLTERLVDAVRRGIIGFFSGREKVTWEEGAA